MKLGYPLLRLLSAGYFVYKVAFSDPHFSWSSIWSIEYTSAGAFAGDLFFRVFFGFVILAFLFYQVRQGFSELNRHEPRRIRFRGLSIIWSLLFYPTAASSLFNISLDLAQITLFHYLLEFYTVATIFGVTASIFVIVEDTRIFFRLRKRRKAGFNSG